MHIHTVKAGDTIFKIARRYSASPMKIIENNGLLNPDRLAVGEKLLILNPTRTYTVRGGDTLMRIADRFSVSEDDIYTKNPYLFGTDKLYPGQLLAIKYDTPAYGMAAANGYYSKGTGNERLSMLLPYLSYLTVPLGKWDGKSIEILLDDRYVLEKAKEKGVIPLMRVYDATDGEKLNSVMADNILLLLKTRGYGGAVIASPGGIKKNKNETTEFLRELKKLLSENDLYLFSEIDGNSPTDDLGELLNASDGNFVMYEKSHLTDIPSFKEGEERLMRELAENAEGRKLYIEIPTSASVNDEITGKGEAESLARGMGREILHDGEKLISYFDVNKYKGGKKETVPVRYESLENVKAKLGLVGELGFMGITFDIESIPNEYLMLFEYMFTRPKMQM